MALQYVAYGIIYGRPRVLGIYPTEAEANDKAGAGMALGGATSTYVSHEDIEITDDAEREVVIYKPE